MQRVIQVIDQGQDSVRVKIRNYHEPLFVGLCVIAKDNMMAFHSDLCHDALMLGQAKKGDKFLWAYRDSGTTMIKLTEPSMDTRKVLNLVNASNCPVDNWHLIEVVKVRWDCHSDGFITWIKPRDISHLGKVISENLKNFETA